MDPLATKADLSAGLGRALTTKEDWRADSLLTAASARVRAETLQNFTKATSTITRRVLHGNIVLPQRPVTDVTAVARAHDDLALQFYWPGLTVVQVWLRRVDDFHDVPGYLRRQLDVVKVTYEHGFDDIPDDVKSVVVNMALRALGSSPTDSALTQESIEGYSYQRGAVGAAGALGMLDEEKRALSAYGARKRAGSIRLSR